MPIYWGDLHAHSGYSKCFWTAYGDGKLDDLYSYAKTEGQLDFCAACDHDIHMTDAEWADAQEVVAAHRTPGRFIALLGYEWTSYAYGHHNVYFPGTEGPLLRCASADGQPLPPQSLFDGLAGREALVIPHHPAVTQFRVDWTQNNSPLVRQLEITSLWGNFEYSGNPHPARVSDTLPGYYACDQLLRGRRFGFVGGSDSHDNRPGDIFFAGRQKPNGTAFNANPLGVQPARCISDASANTRGLTAILADELTPRALWDALLARRTYATTGVRIAITSSVNGAELGSECPFPTDGRVMLQARIEGTAPLRRVAWIRNGTVCHAVECNSQTAETTFEDTPDPALGAWYYCRVEQADGHRAWTSPVWIEPATEENQPSRSPTSAREADRIMVAQTLANTPAATPLATTTPIILQQEQLENACRYTLHWNGTADTCQVTLALRGASAYAIRDIAFACQKYGGDLVTDNQAGNIRWHLYGGSPKGIEIVCAKTEGIDIRLAIEALCNDTPADIRTPDGAVHPGAAVYVSQ